MKHLGDITKIDGAKIEEVDCITFGSPCITADSLILTKDGYKEMENVNPGDVVLTKSNTWQRVLKKFDNGEHETCFLSGTGFENIHCTPEHKFWVRDMKRKGHFGIRTFSEPHFVFAWEDKGYRPTDKRFRWSDIDNPQINIFQLLEGGKE